jgi:hypothetical protein
MSPTPSPEDGNRSSFEMSCSLMFFRIPDDGQSTNPLQSRYRTMIPTRKRIKRWSTFASVDELAFWCFAPTTISDVGRIVQIPSAILRSHVGRSSANDRNYYKPPVVSRHQSCWKWKGTWLYTKRECNRLPVSLSNRQEYREGLNTRVKCSGHEAGHSTMFSTGDKNAWSLYPRYVFTACCLIKHAFLLPSPGVSKNNEVWSLQRSTVPTICRIKSRSDNSPG